MRAIFCTLTLTLTLGLLASMPEPVSSETTDVLLKRVAVRSAAIVQLRHNKARKALLNMSRDRVFESYFAAEGEAHRNLHIAVLGSRSRAMASKLEAQTLTLMDADGSSIVKIVNGDILDAPDTGQLQSPHAWVASLSGDSRPVASPIYLSSQLDRWVVAHARTVTSGNGKDAVLHAEFDLESIQNSVSRRKRPDDIDLLAVTEEGWVVFDSREPISTDRWAHSEDPADYFQRFEQSGMSVQDLMARQNAGELNFLGDGSQSELVVSRADNIYVVAIRNRVLPGAATQ